MSLKRLFHVNALFQPLNLHVLQKLHHAQEKTRTMAEQISTVHKEKLVIQVTCFLLSDSADLR